MANKQINELPESTQSMSRDMFIFDEQGSDNTRSIAYENLFNKLTEDTTVNVLNAWTRQEIQDFIDALPHELDGYELRVIFEDGTYILDKPIVFDNFSNGYLRVYGNSSDGAAVEDKSVIFKSVDSGWDASMDKGDIDGMSGLLVIYHVDKSTIRYIQFDNTNGVARGIPMAGLMNKNSNFMSVYANTFTGDTTNASAAINMFENGGCYIDQNFIGGWDYGVYLFSATAGDIRNSKPTTINTTSNYHSAVMDASAYSMWASSNSLVATGVELARYNGGFYVDDIYGGAGNSYETSFVDGDLTTGKLNVIHNMGVLYSDVQLINNNNVLVQPDSIEYINVNVVDIDLSTYQTGLYLIQISDKKGTKISEIKMFKK